MNENLPKFVNEPVDREALKSEEKALIDRKAAGEEIDEERLKALTEELDYYEKKDQDFRASGHL
jgi:DNA repair exonuclease SbcCD ATPase subunit